MLVKYSKEHTLNIVAKIQLVFILELKYIVAIDLSRVYAAILKVGKTKFSHRHSTAFKRHLTVNVRNSMVEK